MIRKLGALIDLDQLQLTPVIKKERSIRLPTPREGKSISLLNYPADLVGVCERDCHLKGLKIIHQFK